MIEDTGSVTIVRDNSKCVLCRRCVAVCRKMQEVGVIGPVNRGFNTAHRLRRGGCLWPKWPASTAASASPPAPRAR